MEKESDKKQRAHDTLAGEKTRPDDSVESRSERYRKKAEALRDCMLEITTRVPHFIHNAQTFRETKKYIDTIR